MVKSICGVILAARDPKALSAFYSEALALRFEREEHGGLAEHFGVDIGEIHFGIHPVANLPESTPGNAATRIAFNVAALQPVLDRLEGMGAEQLVAPHDEGFGTVATFRDPEGNGFEVVELRYEFGDEGPEPESS